MGGIAFRAPVLAALFLIVTLATLAMPGSANFVGEFLILLGVFQSKLAIAVIASLGVVGAAVYALRLFITRDAQPRRADGHARARSGSPRRCAIVPIVALILVLAFYPQFGLRRSEPVGPGAVAPAQVAASTSASQSDGGDCR